MAVFRVYLFRDMVVHIAYQRLALGSLRTRQAQNHVIEFESIQNWRPRSGLTDVLK